MSAQVDGRVAAGAAHRAVYRAAEGALVDDCAQRVAVGEVEREALVRVAGDAGLVAGGEPARRGAGRDRRRLRDSQQGDDGDREASPHRTSRPDRKDASCGHEIVGLTEGGG